MTAPASQARAVLALAAALVATSAAGCGYVVPATIVGIEVLDDSGGPKAPPTINANTTAAITDLPRPVGAIQELRVKVADPESDPVTLVLQYQEQTSGLVASPGATAPFQTAHLLRVERPDGTTLTSGDLADTGPLPTAPGPAGLEYILFWDWTRDLGVDARSRITLRLSIAGVSELQGGVAFTASDRTIGNNPPALANVRVFGRSGTVAVQYDLSDSTEDTCRIDAFYRIEGGARVTMTAVAAAELENRTPTATPAPFSFTWDTAAEAQIGRARVNVTVELVAVDSGGLASNPVQSGSVAIVNDQPPTAQVTGVPVRAADGEVQVDYTLADPDGDRTGIAPRFHIESGSPLAGGVTTGTATSLGGDDGFENLEALSTGSAHVFRWNAASDLQMSVTGAPARRVSFEVVPTGTAAVPGRSAAFLVGNDAPIATLGALPATATGDVLVPFTLLDSTGDPAAAVLEFAVGAGGFGPATVTGGATVGLATGDGAVAASHMLIWRTAVDLPGVSGVTVTARLRADDGLSGGSGPTDERSIEITNVGGGGGGGADLDVTSITPSGGPPAGGTPVVIVGSGFVDGATTARIGGALVTGTSVIGSSVITGISPPGAAGPADVSVTVGGSTVTRDDGFRYGDAPAIASVSPPDGPLAGGTQITITGAGFKPDETTVTLGGVSLTALSVASGTITGTAQPRAVAGPTDLVVTTPDGLALAAGAFRYLAPPLVTGVAPAEGPEVGGTDVTITGSGFLASSVVVTIGGMPLGSRTIVSDGEIRGRTPTATAAGAATLAVTTPGGMTTTAFTYLAAPTITAVTPARGAAGAPTAVTVTGAAFVDGATQVEVGGVDVTGSVVVASASELLATVPSGAAGPADVVVTTAGGSFTLPNGFTRIAAPTVTAINPAAGPPAGGTLVTILGAGFLPGETTVTIGGLALSSVSVLSDGALTGLTPTSTAGPKAVTVTTLFGTSAPGATFTYQDQEAPAITSVTPPDGPTAGGTTITIAGSGFDPAGTSVFVGGRLFTPTSVSETAIRGLTPTGTAGPAGILVTTAGGVASAAGAFRYLDPPTVGTVAPALGPLTAGTPVTVTGTGFLASAITVTAVGVGDITSVAVASDTLLTGKMPAGGAGTVAIRVTTPGGSTTGALADGFTYLAQPTIGSLSATSGPTTGNTPVIISGTGFAPGATEVRFGGVLATPSSVSDAAISVTTPAHAEGGVSILVTTPGGTTTTASDAFTYEPTASAPLSLAFVSPDVGAPSGSTAVTIVGSGFTSGSPVTVNFGGNAATNVTVSSDMVLTARTPPGSVVGTPVTVTVTVGGQPASPSLGFTYVPAVSFARASTIRSFERSEVQAVVVFLDAGTSPLATTVSVAVVTGAGTTMTLNEDHSFPGSVTVQFPKGTATGAGLAAAITLIADQDPEPPERLVLKLQSPSGCVIGGIAQHVITVFDDDTSVSALSAAPQRAFVAAPVTLSATVSAPALASPPLYLYPGPVDVTGSFPPSIEVTPFPLVAGDAPSEPDPRAGFRLGAGVPGQAERMVLGEAHHAGAARFSYFQQAKGAPDGSFVVIGSVFENVTLTASGGSPSVTVSSPDGDIFVARFTADGSPMWVRRIGGPIFDQPFGIAAFPDGGAVAVGSIVGRDVGSSAGFPEFEGPGGLTRTAIADEEFQGFIARYDPDGALLWVQFTRDVSSVVQPKAEVKAVAALPDGGCVIAVDSGADILFGEGEPFSATVSATGDNEIALARYSPDGQLVRAWPSGGADVTALEPGPDGGVFLAGVWPSSSQAEFGLGEPTAVTLTSVASVEGFVASFGPDGSFRWVHQLRDESTSVAYIGLGAMPDGGVAAALAALNRLVIDPGPLEMAFPKASNNLDNLVVLRFSPDGAIEWVRRSTGASVASSLVVDTVAGLPDGSVMVTGAIYLAGAGASQTFGAGEVNETTIVTLGQDLYVTRFAPGGDLLWAFADGGAKSEFPDAQAVFPDGTLRMLGNYGVDLPLAPTVLGRDEPTPTTLTPTAENDIFYARYEPRTYTIAEVKPAGIAWASGIRPASTSIARAFVDDLASFPDASSAACGRFQGAEATFGPGEPGDTITGPGGTLDQGFVARYDPDGRLAWARGVTSTSGRVHVTGIAAMPGGDVVAVGDFTQATTFEGDAGLPRTPSGTAGTSPDIFVARYRPADGSLRWLVTIGGSGDDLEADVAAFPDGSVAVAGTAVSSGGDRPTFGSTDGLNQTAAGSGTKFFIARYRADGTLKGTVHEEARDLRKTRVAPLSDGGLVIGALDAQTGMPVVMRYSATNTAIWENAIQSTSFADLLGLTTLPDGGVVAVGRYAGVVTVATNPDQTRTSDGSSNGFAVCYEPTGAFRWVREVGGAASEEMNAVAALPDGGALVLCTATGTAVTFDSGFFVLVTSTQAEDVFLARYSAGGALVPPRLAGGVDSDNAGAVATFADGSAVVGGGFIDQPGNGAVFGDPGTEPNWRTLSFGTGGGAGFIAKYFPYSD